jgi:hypothetical protein
MSKNATIPIKVCPEGKELNPVTKKTCLNLCKEGTIRNLLTAKCDKIPNENNPKRGRPRKNKIADVKPPSSPSRLSPRPPSHPRTPPLHSPYPSPRIHHSPKSPFKKNSSDKSDKSIKSIYSASSRTSVSSNSNKEFELYYPDIEDPNFTSKISNNKEFLIHKIPDFPIINNVEEFDEVSNKLCEKFDKMLYQHFVGQYISYRTPYRSTLLYHGVGVGKTCSAITIAESLLSSQVSTEPMIWVIMPQSLKTSFKSEVFKIDEYDTLEELSNQCTDQNYIKLLNIYKSTFDKGNKERQDKKGGVKEYRELLKKELKALLKTRYEIFTYDRFAKHIKDNYTNKIVENKVIIIDEAHNIRSTNKKVKDTYLALMKCLEKGVNNRLILLSATPMYNEPRDILELLKLLIINDKRINILNENKKLFNNKTFNIDDPNVIKLIKSLSGRYISYLKGKNPFTFALKLNPSNSGIKVLEKAPNKDMNNKVIKKENLDWLKNIDDDIVISKLGEAQKKLIERLERLDKLVLNDSKDDNDIDIGEEDDNSDDKQNNNMKLLQPMNIVYDNDIGIKGFYNFFSKTKETDPIELKYAEGYKNALLPDEEHLGKYSGKFLNICNFIRKSKGIVVIYSRFLLSGIIPIAICLEHLGYTRDGATNILKNADIVKDKPVYEGINNPKYCILTSDKREYMGNTKIDDFIKIINSKANHNGEKIKVILITPVASEGLSFFNTREIHLIEPWYHFNRADQIIGRGIRNCRHNRLNIENRNVSVFMHASVNDDAKRESIDINAFRISTRKYIESKKVDKIIMDNAIDCHLMKNINYFPKSIFKLDNINIETSQGALIKYNYGDKEIDEPKCNVNNEGVKINSKGFRSEIYKHLVPSIKNNIRNIINNLLNANNTGNIYIDFPMLKSNMGYKIDNDILMYSIKNIIYPNIFIKNKYITRYKDGILISPIDINGNNATGKIIRYNNDMLIKSIDANAVNSTNAANADINDKSPNVENKAIYDKKAVQKILDNINIDLNDVNKTTISIYLNITADNFKILIGYILKSFPVNTGAANNFDTSIRFICDCLYKQGILIKDKDIPSYSNNDNNDNEYIGYINMFNENNEDDNTYIQYKDKNNKIIKNRNDKDEYFKMIEDKQSKMIRENIKLYNAKKQLEENARPAYITEYFSNRIFKRVYIPHDMSEEDTAWGIIIRSKVKGKGETVDKYIFKVFKPVKGNLTGMECTSYNRKDQDNIISVLIASVAGVAGEDNNIKKKNKHLLCEDIAKLLLIKNKLVLYPLYKPKE